MELEKIENHRVQVILQFAIPSIAAMVLTSMINVIDGYFMGNFVGTEGLAAVNLGLPIVYLYLAVGLMIAVGGISIAGRLLGADCIDKANQVFRQTILTCILVTVILSIIMTFLLKPLPDVFPADVQTKEYFQIYYGVMLLELPIMVLISAFGMFIRGEGNPVFVMVTNIIAVVLNYLLDYLFVGPMSLGAAGIAWASFLSGTMILILNILYVLRVAKVFHFGTVTFDRATLTETFFNGSSEFIGELSMCISMVAYNDMILKTAGVEGVAAFTIVGYISYVFSMIVVGFGQGIVPMISFAYGAEKPVLARQVRNTTCKMVVGAAVFIFLMMSTGAGWYCRLFSDNKSVVDMVVPGLRLQMSSFAFAGINTIASFYFTAIGKAKESAVISASRGLVVLMIAIMILPQLLGITGIWLVSLTTETVTLLFTVMYIRKNTQDQVKEGVVCSQRI